jgi:hypothetical protein
LLLLLAAAACCCCLLLLLLLLLAAAAMCVLLLLLLLLLLLCAAPTLLVGGNAIGSAALHGRRNPRPVLKGAIAAATRRADPASSYLPLFDVSPRSWPQALSRPSRAPHPFVLWYFLSNCEPCFRL